MNASNQRQLTTLIIMSLLLAATAGCGNGKKGKHRANLHAAADALTKADGAEELTPEQKEAQAKAQAEQDKLDQEFATLKENEDAIIGAAEQVSVKDLPAGLYTLTALATAFEYRGLDEEKLITLDARKVTITKDDQDKAKSVALSGDEQDRFAGLMSNDTDAGRKLDLAAGFKVSTGSERLSRTNSLNVLFSTKSNGKGNDDAFATELGGDEKLQASVMGLLTAGEISEDSAGKQVLTVKDADGKTVTLRLFKAGEKTYQIYLSIDELLSDDAAKIRNVYLTYSFQAAEAPKSEVTAEADAAIPQVADETTDGAATDTTSDAGAAE